jgi:methyl-accepting chemotaxis protein
MQIKIKKMLNSVSFKFLSIICLILVGVFSALFFFAKEELEQNIKSNFVEKGRVAAQSLAMSLSRVAELDINNGIFIDGKLYKGEELEKLLFDDNVTVIKESEQVAEKRKKDPKYAEQKVKLHDGKEIPLWQYELKFISNSDKYTDLRWQSVIDSYMGDKNIVFALPTMYSKDPNKSGYIGTHNSAYSPVGEKSKDAWGDEGLLSQKYRANRIFNDSTGYNASKYTLEEVNASKNAEENNNGALIQQYPRVIENKVVQMWDVAYPITINGKHWGGVRVAMSQEKAEMLISKEKRAVLTQFIIIGSIVLIFMLFLTHYMVGRRITKLHNSTETIFANDKINLSSYLKVGGKDEIGQLNNEINNFLRSLKETVASLQEVSSQIEGASNDLHVTADGAKELTVQVVQEMQNMARGAETQAENVAQGVNAVEEITEGIAKVSESSAAVMEASSVMVSRSEQGNESVQYAMKQIDELGEASNKVSKKIEVLDQLSHEIGTIAMTITHISNQTNILALNASIEAARSGEHGKGFVVVANEVKKLAEQSKQSADQIKELIQRIQEATTEAVEVMNTGESEVKKSKGVIHQVGESLTDILQSARHVDKEIQEVTATTQEISAGAQEARASIEEIAAIANDFSQNMSKVLLAAEGQADSIKSVAKSAEMLHEMFERLQHIIQKFEV